MWRRREEGGGNSNGEGVVERVPVPCRPGVELKGEGRVLARGDDGVDGGSGYGYLVLVLVEGVVGS